MKVVYFENIRNKERFYCKDVKDVMVIDGAEYLKVFQAGNNRECLVNKQYLRKVEKTK